MSDTNENGQIQSEGQTDEPVPSSEQPAEDVQDLSQPDQVSERTAEQFEKLTAHNKAMAEELVSLRGSKPLSNSVLDELRPNSDMASQTAIPQAESQQFVDDGGYVDTTLLNSTLSDTQRAAKEARQIAVQTQQQIQRFQESQVMQAVHKDFPEMDPNNSDHFDPAFYDYVKNDLIGQAFQGKEDVRSAALKAKHLFGTKPAPVQEARKETISSRGQASAPTGTAKGVPEPLDHNDLVEGTRKGDKDAIAKRLQASGY